FLPQTRLHRAASNQLYAILQDGQVQNLRQMVTEDNSTQRRIMWQSASPMESPRVAVRTGLQWGNMILLKQRICR
ncbi:MAG: hypothetical protein IIX37_06920, partial [Selenomonadaceae bacterium]|nr:hypothetical protein [Selenomonadaceae bacterium]